MLLFPNVFLPLDPRMRPLTKDSYWSIDTQSPGFRSLALMVRSWLCLVDIELFRRLFAHHLYILLRCIHSWDLSWIGAILIQAGVSQAHLISLSENLLVLHWAWKDDVGVPEIFRFFERTGIWYCSSDLLRIFPLIDWLHSMIHLLWESEEKEKIRNRACFKNHMTIANKSGGSMVMIPSHMMFERMSLHMITIYSPSCSFTLRFLALE
jgi:hypothetical protein